MEDCSKRLSSTTDTLLKTMGTCAKKLNQQFTPIVTSTEKEQRGKIYSMKNTHLPIRDKALGPDDLVTRIVKLLLSKGVFPHQHAEQ